MRTRINKIGFATGIFLLGSISSFVALAATAPGVPAGPGPNGQYVPYGQGQGGQQERLPQGNYGPQGLGNFGPNVPGFNPNTLPRDFRPDYLQTQPREERSGERNFQDDYPIPGFEPGTREAGQSYPGYIGGDVGIDSDDACMLRDANNTVAARGECTMNRSCIVQERGRNGEGQWRDSIGNPAIKQNGLEYRAFCSR